MSELDSRVVFTAVVAVVAGLRLAELRVSRRNTRRLLARGATEAGQSHYPLMVALHAVFLISCVAEVWLLRRPWIEAVGLAAAAVLAAALALRFWTLSTLGERWTTRVLVVPGERLVAGGPYRWLRHPNYSAVVLEIAAIPMLHAAWLTAVVFSIANLALLRVRIAVEDRALTAAAPSPPELDGRTA
jgi:methyltransferase